MKRLPETLKTLAPALFLTLLVTGCGSMALPGILGGGGGGGDGTNPAIGSVQGTVERVDTSNRSIVVDGASSQSKLRNDGRGERYVLYYDDQTRVEYEGEIFRPVDLEVGDRILAQVNDDDGRLQVDEIEVLYDVSSGGGLPDDDPYDDDPYDDDPYGDDRGYVRDARVLSVDTRDRILEVERRAYRSGFAPDTGTRDVLRLYWDESTSVEYDGRRGYDPENLERGDIVDIETRESGRRLYAEEIIVISNVRAGR